VCFTSETWRYKCKLSKFIWLLPQYFNHVESFAKLWPLSTPRALITFSLFLSLLLRLSVCLSFVRILLFIFCLIGRRATYNVCRVPTPSRVRFF
jgi:hypothetical protein